MQLLRLKGALVPHAPLLLPEMTPEGENLRAIWDGLGRVTVPADALVIVLSPHSPRVGIYERAEGSLKGFGRSDVNGTFLNAGIVDGPRISEPLDHGALVPLLLFKPPAPVVVVGLGGRGEASELTEVINTVRAVAAESEAFVIASAHTSARLTERAPLPYSYDAVRLEARLIGELERDCAAARDLAPEIRDVGGSCSASTLTAFGTLFAGAEGNVLAYGSPFGVGYPVVTAETDV